MNGVHSTATPTTRLLFADSKNRDAALYPSGSSYVLHLTTPIKEIERVDLVSARVPNVMYNLTAGSACPGCQLVQRLHEPRVLQLLRVGPGADHHHLDP